MKKNKKYIALLLSGLFLCSSIIGCSNTDESSVSVETTEIETTPQITENNKTPLTAPSEELYKKVEKMNDACERYFAKNKSSKTFYTWAGLLSYIDDDNTQKELTPQTLLDLGYLNDENFVQNAFNVYMKPIDIDKSYKKTSLDIFTVLETSEGFITYGKGYERKLIPAETFRSTIMNYNPDNGTITNPPSNGELYKSLMNSICLFRKDASPEYVVRYVCANDLYAIVILSGKDDVTDTTEYLLKKENNNWSVIKNALENENNLKTSLNQSYPNFDLKLLPPYTLGDYRKQVRTTEHYTAILDMLKNQNIIDKNDEVEYCCGTDKVLYFEFKSGKKLAGGATNNGEFSCNLVTNYEEAIKELARFGEPIPAFILKYDK